MRLLISLLVIALLVGGSTTLAQAEVFLLRSGGRVEGEWLNPQRGGTERLSSGCWPECNSHWPVRRCSGCSLLRTCRSNTKSCCTRPPPASMAIGRWPSGAATPTCQLSGSFISKRSSSSILITKRPASPLATGKFATGGWMTPDEYMLRQGYVKSRGQWKLPQEIEIDARERDFELADKEWRKKIKMWLDNIKRDNKRAGDSLDAIQSIRDPSAAMALSPTPSKTKMANCRCISAACSSKCSATCPPAQPSIR